MSNYLFIESRDPFESQDNRFVADTALSLKEGGNDVTVFLIQNGVLGARREACDRCLSRLAESGVNVLADDFSLGERGISENDLRPGVTQSGIGALVEILVSEKTKAIWH